MNVKIKSNEYGFNISLPPTIYFTKKRNCNEAIPFLILLVSEQNLALYFLFSQRNKQAFFGIVNFSQVLFSQIFNGFIPFFIAEARLCF